MGGKRPGHYEENSPLSMVDVGGKPTIFREATAKGMINLKQETIKLIKTKRIEKGNVLDLARTAGILAAKKTSELIPLCHPLNLSTVKIRVELGSDSATVHATVRAYAKTGVEMEALTAVSMALLTIWDMTKQYEKDPTGQYPTTVINSIRVLTKVKQSE